MSVHVEAGRKRDQAWRPWALKPSIEQRKMLFRLRSTFHSPLLMNGLNSPIITHRVQELTGGSASSHLNVRDIRAFPTPIAPLADLHEIVRRVEQLFALADRLEAQLDAARKRVDLLTQSILNAC